MSVPVLVSQRSLLDVFHCLIDFFTRALQWTLFAARQPRNKGDDGQHGDDPFTIFQHVYLLSRMVQKVQETAPITLQRKGEVK